MVPGFGQPLLIALQQGFIGMGEGSDGLLVQAGSAKTGPASPDQCIRAAEPLQQFDQASAPQAGGTQNNKPVS
jgi:hypothetical protein